MLSSALLIANQPTPHTVSAKKTSLVKEFTKLRDMINSYNSGDKNVSKEDIQNYKNFINTKATLVMIVRTGGKKYLFKIFEQNLKENNITFKDLDVISAKDYEKLKNNFSKIK